MRVKSLLPFAATSAIALAAGGAHATTMAYTSQSTFSTAATGGSAPPNQVADQVNWAQFDASLANPQPADGGTIAYGSQMTTSLGETVTVTNNGTGQPTFTTFTQGGATWNGSFAAGTTVLYNGNSESTTLTFASALSGLGVDLQVKASTSPGSYTFTLTAYDVNNNALGSATDTGVSHGITTGTTYDNTVKFAGILSSSANISYVTITSSNDNVGFAIDTSLIYHNNLQTGGSGSSQQTPEPGTLGLLGAGLAGLGLVRRKKLLRSSRGSL